MIDALRVVFTIALIPWGQGSSRGATYLLRSAPYFLSSQADRLFSCDGGAAPPFCFDRGGGAEVCFFASGSFSVASSRPISRASSRGDIRFSASSSLGFWARW